ncbi:MAG: TlpA disulfide reductase family protein, partial [Bacteroidota bacterium]
CRDELPKLNSFYLENGKNKNSEIVLITIASRDFEENVIAFIQNNNYKFPVIMSDNKIEKNYSVIGFPTKVLISPNGYYFNIPYQSDFQKIANDYMNLKKYL